METKYDIRYYGIKSPNPMINGCGWYITYCDIPWNIFILSLYTHITASELIKMYESSGAKPDDDSEEFAIYHFDAEEAAEQFLVCLKLLMK